MSIDESKLGINPAEYLNPTLDRTVDEKILELVSEFVIPKVTGGRILELGVGDQIWTPKLVDRFNDVTTVDASSVLLTAMQEKLLGKRWMPVLCMFEEYRPEKSFDTVLATYVLEHVDDPSVIFQLAKRQWLKPGGQLVVVVPHALSLHRRLAVAMDLAPHCGYLGETDRRMGHKHCFSVYEMEKLLIQNDFAIVEKTGMFTKVLPNILLVQCSDAQLRGMFQLGLELPIEYSAAICFIAESRR